MTIVQLKSRGRRQAMAAHDLGQSRRVRWYSNRRLYERGDFSEIVRAEDAGSDDSEHLRGIRMKVIESMDGATNNT